MSLLYFTPPAASQVHIRPSIPNLTQLIPNRDSRQHAYLPPNVTSHYFRHLRCSLRCTCARLADDPHRIDACHQSNPYDSTTSFCFCSLTPTELDTRQASNETAPPQASTPAGNITITPCMTAQPGDTCDGAASQLAVSLSDFLAANPSVDSACDNFLAGVVYCA